jgi:hypothetical protein
VVTVVEDPEDCTVVDFTGLLVSSELSVMAGVEEAVTSELSEGFDDGKVVTETVRDEDCVLLIVDDADCTGD